MQRSIIRYAKGTDWRHRASWILGAALVIIVVYYGGLAILANAHAPVRLVVYAFSTQEEVLTQGIFPSFEAEWEAETGREVTIEGVFGPSGTLAGQINLGAPADVAVFSNAQHVSWLKVGRQVRRENEPSVIARTPMVIVTRTGNPLGIAEFPDLARPGLRLLHADPRSSGAGDWAVLAEYGSALLESGDQIAAQSQLQAIWRNVRLLGPSARATLTLFELGAGDALVTYEQDARLAMERGAELQIVTPPRTIVAHHVAVVIDRNVTPAERPVAQAFVNFLLSDAGQQILSQYHLRPVDQDGDVFPKLLQPFTVEDLGGWSRAYTDLVEVLWEKEIEPRLELKPGPTLLGAGE
jgi:ABC-type sulfate transport system substrate-binding protein